MRTLNLKLEVTDTEFENFLRHLNGRANVIEDGETLTTTNPVAATGSGEPLPGATGVTDVKGVVYNPLYHAKSKTTKADGTWKAAKGLDETGKAAAAQYAAGFSVAETEPVLTTSEVPAFLQRDVTEDVVAPTTAPIVPVAPVVPMTIPVAPVAVAPVSFEQLSAGFAAVIERIGQDKLMTALAGIYTAAGVAPDGESLQTNETQRAAVLASINAL